MFTFVFVFVYINFVLLNDDLQIVFCFLHRKYNYVYRKDSNKDGYAAVACTRKNRPKKDGKGCESVFNLSLKCSADNRKKILALEKGGKCVDDLSKCYWSFNSFNLVHVHHEEQQEDTSKSPLRAPQQGTESLNKHAYKKEMQQYVASLYNISKNDVSKRQKVLQSLADLTATLSK
jgi:hypothetical protein